MNKQLAKIIAPILVIVSSASYAGQEHLAGGLMYFDDNCQTMSTQGYNNVNKLVAAGVWPKMSTWEDNLEILKGFNDAKKVGCSAMEASFKRSGVYSVMFE